MHTEQPGHPTQLGDVAGGPDTRPSPLGGATQLLWALNASIKLARGGAWTSAVLSSCHSMQGKAFGWQ